MTADELVPAVERMGAPLEYFTDPFRLAGEGRFSWRQTGVGAERTFAIYKRCYGLGRTRFLGLAKNTTVYGLAAIAHNIRKGARFLDLYGVAEPVCGE